MTLSDPIIVRVLKYDGTEHRRWKARLARRDGSLIVLDAEFETEVEHEALGTVPRGTRTLEYYWLDRWYNIFQFLNEDGSTRLYYCNVNLPPKLEAGELIYIDLDIDVLVQTNLSYQVLDLEEFEANVGRYGYSRDVRDAAHGTVDQLVAMIEARAFPFSEVEAVSSV